LQALKATSQEKSVFLRREKDAWASFESERAAREAAEGELAKECEISAELRQKCSALATEAREARDKVAPLEERIGVLAQESEVQKAAAEGYKGEVARLEALLAEKDLALNQTQADLAGALSQVARWHQSSAEHVK
jgi:chromosome segregation ATPase